LILNLRDVGGCRTAAGRSVARGILFRSAELAWRPSSVTHPVLEHLGIRRVIDLRTWSEVEERGGHDVPPFVERIHQPFLESLDRDFQPIDQIDRSPPATAARYYDYLLEGRASVRSILGALLTARSRPTLIHCVAGRDRTGIVIGCLLCLLGVPDEAIARDYAASHVMDDDEGRHAHPDNILHLLRLLRERHGSVESALTEGRSRPLPLRGLEDALLDPPVSWNP
jgi:hypothetical protein